MIDLSFSVSKLHITRAARRPPARLAALKLQRRQQDKQQKELNTSARVAIICNKNVQFMCAAKVDII